MTTALQSAKEPDRLEVWREITNAWRVISRGAEKQLAPFNMSVTEFKILRVLHDDGPTAMARLSDACVLTQPAITSFVDKLESLELVKRERDLKDRRVIRIAMTKKGEALYLKGYEIYSQYVDRLLTEISSGELARLASIMKKLSLAGNRQHEEEEEED